MKKTKVKIPAKINLTLDVVSSGEKFHNLASLVASINLYDSICVKKRNDKKITLKEKGIKAQCTLENNNAYKTAKTILDSVNAFGVDITIKKNIPVGAGLGGSSADIAGVLVGYDSLLGGVLDLYSLASKLGSDVNYMLGGGYAVIKGKGDDIEYLEIEKKLYIIILSAKEMITSKDCFLEYDNQNKTYPCVTEKAVKYLLEDNPKFFEVLSNHLYSSAQKLLPKIKENYQVLKDYGSVTMSGSGNSIIGIYQTAKERNEVAKILKKKKIKYILAETI